MHDRFRPLIWVLEDHGKAAHALNQRRDICLATLLFEQHQITLPCVDAPFDASDIFDGLDM